jgi:hypothetical protein
MSDQYCHLRQGITQRPKCKNSSRHSRTSQADKIKELPRSSRQELRSALGPSIFRDVTRIILKLKLLLRRRHLLLLKHLQRLRNALVRLILKNGILITLKLKLLLRKRHPLLLNHLRRLRNALVRPVLNNGILITLRLRSRPRKQRVAKILPIEALCIIRM